MTAIQHVSHVVTEYMLAGCTLHASVFVQIQLTGAGLAVEMRSAST